MPEAVDHLRLVGWVLKTMRFDAVDREDLFQEGVLGLMEACRRYKGGKGVKFSYFARIYIRRWMITHALRFATPLSIHPNVLSDALAVERGTKKGKETWARVPQALNTLKMGRAAVHAGHAWSHDRGPQDLEDREFVGYLRSHLTGRPGEFWAIVNGLEGERLTKAELGRKVGLTGERIRQIVAQAEGRVEELVAGLRD